MKIRQATTSKEKDDAYSVRTIVFVKEQHVPPEIEIDEYDETAIHLIGYENDEPIAASRVRFTDNCGKLERICVLHNQRGKSRGSQMIKAMESLIKENGYKKAKLNAQTHAIEFYRRLGYEVVSDEFMDAGIPHVTMVKTLT
ncbi:GNAT family N-acetyltransferase [Lentibacillus cibarius]|uniref:GNAT family N-acetyltransferase n=1 Tax=Lentibacillus cibarius TaxID=2583219 RepID=A0A5S3QMF7_9BACI|nr:GNAT family N-acetyltransferase [Lentibacillus cibarius]TMN23144.1 GNAT family N-acetyltransferase [Lentibacillus cibarius]